MTSLQAKSDKRKVYLVRDDSFFCTGKKQTEFVKEFCDILQNYTDAEVVYFDAGKQIESVKRHIKRKYKGIPVMSLDKWFKGDFNYSISRVFYKGEDQSKPFSFQSNNPSETCDWLNNLTVRSIVIVDDDIASGSTMEHVHKFLGVRGISVEGTVSMSDISNRKHKNNVYDIVDIRDFIPNSVNGGLLCFKKDFCGLERVPYFYPEVDLVSRMKLTKDAAVWFTSDLKELLKKHFNYTEK